MPVISVDTKKQELIGNFKNGARSRALTEPTNELARLGSGMRRGGQLTTGAGRSWIGSRMKNVVPLPSSVCSASWPPCLSTTTERAMERP